MCDNSFNSIDRLLEFGMSMAVANQMINTMNYAMSNMNIAGQSSTLSTCPPVIQMYAAIDGKQVGPFSESEIQTLINNGTVTIRDRDTMEQITLKLEEVKGYIEERIKF